MIRIVLSTSAIVALTVLASSVWAVRPDGFFSSTIFTIAGIMFSIGLGLIVTFNPTSIKNRAYLKIVRDNITNVRNSFLLHFASSSMCFILNQYLIKEEFSYNVFGKFDIKFSISIFLCLLMIYSSIYFVVNFLQIQKLNNDISDEVSGGR